MANLTFDQIIEAAETLNREQQALLIARLRVKTVESVDSVTRDSILAEFERRKDEGAFEHTASLHGKFAHPDLDLTFEEIQKITHEAATEWENEIEDFNGSR
jgi:hypothetical protein